MRSKGKNVVKIACHSKMRIVRLPFDGNYETPYLSMPINRKGCYFLGKTVYNWDDIRHPPSGVNHCIETRSSEDTRRIFADAKLLWCVWVMAFCRLFLRFKCFRLEFLNWWQPKIEILSISFAQQSSFRNERIFTHLSNDIQWLYINRHMQNQNDH